MAFTNSSRRNNNFGHDYETWIYITEKLNMKIAQNRMFNGVIIP